MIGQVEFTIIGLANDFIRPYEDYGMYLVNYDAPPPAPKLFRVDIEGRSGSIDMTEWANDVFYGDRSVSIKLRDMRANATEFVSRLNGRRVKIAFDDEPEWYYVGRVDSINASTRSHVTDLSMKCTCDPWKYPRTQDATGQYVNTNGVPYSGYYLLEDTVDRGDSVEWAVRLYQSSSAITLMVSNDFDTENENQATPSKIEINGVATSIDGAGTLSISTRLHQGDNIIKVYNNQSAGDGFDVSIKFMNRVM